MCIYAKACPLEFCSHTCVAELHIRLAAYNDGVCPWYPPPEWAARVKAACQPTSSPSPPPPSPDTMDWTPDYPTHAVLNGAGDDAAKRQQQQQQQQPQQLQQQQRCSCGTPEPQACVACLAWTRFMSDTYRSFTIVQRNTASLERLHRAGAEDPWLSNALEYYRSAVGGT